MKDRQTLTEAINRKVRELEPLSVDGDDIAHIEQGTGDPAGTYVKYRGMIWINDGWITDEQAKALRDWLNLALAISESGT